MAHVRHPFPGAMLTPYFILVSTNLALPGVAFAILSIGVDHSMIDPTMKKVLTKTFFELCGSNYTSPT